MRMPKYFHAEAKHPSGNVHLSDQYAEHIAQEYGENVVKAGGKLTVGRNYGENPASLIIELPEDSLVDPNDLVPGFEFKPISIRVVPGVPDQGIE